MKEMLESIYRYNTRFAKNKNEKKRLNKIIEAMKVIDRKHFISGNSYIDTALPIGEGQTISQPSTVARMLFLLDLENGDNVLEIGTGSGWNACLLAYLVYPGKVLSLERIKSLKEKAEANARKLNLKLNLRFIAENIFEKKEAWKRKYNKIVATAGIIESQINAIEEIAEVLLEEHGMLICPRKYGKILIFRKEKGIEIDETEEEYVFVSLIK